MATVIGRTEADELAHVLTSEREPSSLRAPLARMAN
jgi:hypothetical protein